MVLMLSNRTKLSEKEILSISISRIILVPTSDSTTQERNAVLVTGYAHLVYYHRESGKGKNIFRCDKNLEISWR